MKKKICLGVALLTITFITKNIVCAPAPTSIEIRIVKQDGTAMDTAFLDTTAIQHNYKKFLTNFREKHNMTVTEDLAKKWITHDVQKQLDTKSIKPIKDDFQLSQSATRSTPGNNLLYTVTIP